MRSTLRIGLAGTALLAMLALSVNATAQTAIEDAVEEEMAVVTGTSNHPLRSPRWSPYAVGIGIGVVSWLAFLFSAHPLGVSTAFAKSAGMIERAVRGPKVNQKLYYQENHPTIDWGWMLVIGLFLGAFTAAWLSGTVRWIWLPPMWRAAFGSSVFIRVIVTLVGGICVGFGARWGCGCTSGHGISGTMQLVLASWLSAACFFVGGIAVAMLLYRVF